MLAPSTSVTAPTLRLQIPTVATSSLSKADRFLLARAPQSFPQQLALMDFRRNLQYPRVMGGEGIRKKETIPKRMVPTGRVLALFGGRGVQHSFPLSQSFIIKIMKGDITMWGIDGKTDAIVNEANETLLGGDGLDGAVHRYAGPELREACKRIQAVRPYPRCPTGEARITPGFQLPAAYVIHAVGPTYYLAKEPEVLLTMAYRNSLKLAEENNINYVALPSISCGVYGFPEKEAARISISVAKEFADSTIKEIHFVLFSSDLCSVWLDTALDLLMPK